MNVEQTLPRLFSSATKLDDSQQRVAALDALTSITASVRGQRVSALADAPKRRRSHSHVDPVERGQRQVEQVRKRLGMQMDDRQFQAALVESQVCVRDLTWVILL
jgi:rapamycin-insensitive companion of mTOR